MKHLIRLTALCVGLLLLAAPVVWACGEFSAMTPQCPMTEMTDTMGTSMCHDAGQMSDCCDVTSAPEPMQALSVESAKLLMALEVTDLQVAAALAPAALLLRSMSAEAFRQHDLGRYTLFSSFLL